MWRITAEVSKITAEKRLPAPFLSQFVVILDYVRVLGRKYWNHCRDLGASVVILWAGLWSVKKCSKVPKTSLRGKIQFWIRESGRSPPVWGFHWIRFLILKRKETQEKLIWSHRASNGIHWRRQCFPKMHNCRRLELLWMPSSIVTSIPRGAWCGKKHPRQEIGRNCERK